MHFLLYMYYMHPGNLTSICGKNCAYYIRIFTVTLMQIGLKYINVKRQEKNLNSRIDGFLENLNRFHLLRHFHCRYLDRLYSHLIIGELISNFLSTYK